jgi:hypothetical protein
MPYIPNMQFVFADNILYQSPQDEQRHCIVRQKALGNVHLPTGRIVACDPYILEDIEFPFAVEVTPGDYPVILTVANCRDRPDIRFGSPRIAFARIQVRDEMPVTWEMALYPGQNAGQFKDDEITGYGVDAGTGCFMDQAAVPILEARAGGDKNDTYFDAVMEAKYSLPDVLAGNFVVDESKNLNMILFQSGWGDGYYASYWGFNAQHEPVCLVTDFNILTDDEPEA